MSHSGGTDIQRSIEGLKKKLPPQLANLATLAYNYWWSWTVEGPALFRQVEPLLWHQTNENPVRLLQETDFARLDELAADTAFVAAVNALAARFEVYMHRPGGASGHEDNGTRLIMGAEFGLHASLPIYAGGLGVLMGDTIKEASDQAVPTVGLGLLYSQGSFHQRLDKSGWQHEFWLDTDTYLLPTALVRDERDKPLTVTVHARGRLITARIWRVDVGRVPLYLLDTNHLDNRPADRQITSRLYVGDRETRLAQYAVLGIGGIRAMRAMGIDFDRVHLNEGHAALACIELLREGLDAKLDYETAWDRARRGTTFTTHTPVPAGNDTFTPEAVSSCLGELPSELGLDLEGFMALGRVNPHDTSEPFGTTPLALRLSSSSNAVSRRHGEVSRAMWAGMWPERPVAEVPIGHVTNGVHLDTWMAPEMQALLDRYLPRHWRSDVCAAETWAAIDEIPDEELWAVRCQLRKDLVTLVRERNVLDRLGRDEPSSYAEAAAELMDDAILTLGFVRRIATYKRLYLLTMDIDRGILLLDGSQPTQLVIAGKAHPQDDDAKRTVQALFAYNRHPVAAGRTAFLEDMDLRLEASLVQGCDVWINLPRPPNEASGTSGMKSALNGGLQLSVLDGWWAEAYDGSNGWAIDTPQDAAPAEQDAHDSAALYDLLEKEIVPLFNARDAGSDLPRAWVRKVKTSLKTLAPRFNTTRMLTQYLEAEAGAATTDS